MSTPIMDSFRVSQHNFPLTLYRVEYPGTQTSYSQQSGFQAASTFTPYSINGLRNAVEYHLDWRCRVLSPFISTFSNREHAHNWARVWSENNNHRDWCFVVVVTLMPQHGVTVFRVADLVNRLGINTSLDPSQYESEYLCFQRIPPGAVVREQEVSYPARLGYATFGGDSDSDSDDGYY
ncbi:hypothetical protein M408DRAFT_330422 [Serendipita vermifera MAFF 305830]|uniref:DUF7587 domain-containing protein n=1 Tax=Serendipita vermifera MAFF 305830 TaxID=933852 RepID=A0A0C3AQK4_SERVB|nr:hypothetical protein M408DRAFT_330422 [Serendipita vermifera MAFF 305830]